MMNCAIYAVIIAALFPNIYCYKWENSNITYRKISSGRQENESGNCVLKQATTATKRLHSITTSTASNTGGWKTDPTQHSVHCIK